MTARRAAAAAAGVTVLAVLGGLGWWLLGGRSHRTAPLVPPAATADTAPAPALGRRINAKLFYVSEEGTRLTDVEREVPYADQPVEQARAILAAQMAPAVAPQVSAVPAGTTLRALFLTPQGDAYVDLSAEVSSAHPGGSLNERLTIYTFVHALTLNLPAIRTVQILVDGHEVDTLAGHVDLRRPLAKDLQLTMKP